MKKRSVLAFSLLTACGGILVGACSGEDGTPQPQPVAGSGGSSGEAPIPTGGTATEAGASTGGAAATAGTESAGTGGTGQTCDLPSLEIFQRSDSDQSWDDQDFSDVVLTTGCPTIVDVTWPHEADWELPDKVDANFEPTHFTIDSYYSSDLTGKQINVELELTQDMRGPLATAGGYVAYLVSVSTYDRVIVVEPTPTAGTGGTAGNGGSSGADAGTSGISGEGGSGGTAGSEGEGTGGENGGLGGDTATGGVGEAAGTGGTAPTTITETGYQEAVAEGRVTFTRVGEKATLSFALPNKTDAVDSYDPSRVIKINIRIESLFTPPAPAEGTAGAGAGGTAGVGGDSAIIAPGGFGGNGNGGSDPGTGRNGGSSESAGTAGDAAVSGSGGTSGDTGTAPAPTPPTGPYDYLTSQFTITKFTVTDAL